MPRADVPNDSCDEFAFAHTKQSGGYLGLTGKDCAEIVPRQHPETGEWYHDTIRWRGTERCLQAHVPLPENSLVGADLGAMTIKERLLDNDSYYINVYL